MLSAARSSLKSRRALARENLALPQQLPSCDAKRNVPSSAEGIRAFCIVLARLCG
jgi:hypothetical protein